MSMFHVYIILCWDEREIEILKLHFGDLMFVCLPKTRHISFHHENLHAHRT